MIARSTRTRRGACALLCALLCALNACTSDESAAAPDAATTASAPDAGEDAAAPDAPPDFTERELADLAALRYDDSPPPADPSNRVDGDPAARVFGQRLFFDASLSGPLIDADNDGSAATLGHAGEAGRVSCASCHVPASGFVDTRSPHKQISLASQWTSRRTPTLLEIGFAPLYNWDGRRDSLWNQAIGVMESAAEFNSGRLLVAQQIHRLHRDEYEAIFGAMPMLDDVARFPPLAPKDAGCIEELTSSGPNLICRGKPGDGADYDGMTEAAQDEVTEVTVNVAKAMAAYVALLRCGPSRFDAWLDGDDEALSASEQRGAQLFVTRGKCVSCHSGPNLTDGAFHNVGMSPAPVAVAFIDHDDRGAAEGLAAALEDPLSTNGAFSDGDREALPDAVTDAHEGAFRTPTLRCMNARPSFMHTGQIRTASQVVAFFNRGGDPPGNYPGVSELTRLDLSERDRADLVAFMAALEGDGPDASLRSPPPSDAMSSAPIIGERGCGFDHAAFCDTFDAPSTHRGRAGDLDARLWSAGHVQPSLPTSPGFTFGILPATIPECRSDLPAQVFPGNDALICDPVPSVASNHLLVACGAQNYGATSLRIRQPFDFADRTGTIAFDADGFVINPLLGWIQVSVTEDPMAVPSYAILGNDEGGVVPRNGFEVHFARNCPDGMSMGARMIALYEERVETIIDFPEGATCIPVKESHLNHFEVRVSESRIEVYTSPWSEDGTSFPPVQLLIAADVQLPFTRGYVTIAVHNHATIKYSEGDSPYSDRFYDAWVARWDNVGFDGPVLPNFREYEIPDATQMHEGTLNIGYRIADEMNGPSHVLTFPDVDLTGAVSARIAQTSYYLPNEDEASYVLRYRLNGHDWHDRTFDAGELHAASHNSQGAFAQVLDVPLSELQNGDNTLEYVTRNVPQSYPPAALNIDLVLNIEP